MEKSSISESLCGEFLRLDFLCRKLKKSDHIHDTWFYNNRLYLQVTEGDPKCSVSHITDLISRFGASLIDSLLVMKPV